MVVDEVSHIVDNTSDGNEASTILCLLDVIIPLHDWELIERDTPIEFGSLLVNLLLELLNTALFDFVGSELFEVISETELLGDPDGPLGWVILPPLDSIAVVGWELVMEVMISFSKSDEGSDNVVSWRVSVVKWLVAKPMGKRIDAEGGLLNEEDSKNACVDEAAHVITPAKTCNERWEDQTSENDDFQVVLVLPDNDWILIEIRNICSSYSFWVLLHQHPTEVRVEKTFADRVWVLLGVGISVMGSVISCPPSD